MKCIQLAMSPFRETCDWSFLDGPLTVSPLPEIAPFVKVIKQSTYHTWLKHVNDYKAYEGFGTAVQTVLDEVERLGGVDALMGFSQGALIATLAGKVLYEKKKIRAVICVCGVDSKRDEGKEGFSVPSFHVYGARDKMAPRSKKLFSQYTGPKVLVEHAAGHKFPSAKEKVIAVRLVEFLSKL